MFDFKPVGYVVGLFILGLGAAMIATALVDYWMGSTEWRAFVASAVLTCLTGGALALGCDSGKAAKLSIPQTFLLLVLIWVMLPLFGALPFMFGTFDARTVDALFEAVSGLTTTGATVFSDFQLTPPGALIWRALLQWIGGVGVAIFAVAFLPSLRIGGMQLFARSDGGDPETVAIYAMRDIGPPVVAVYAALTVLCAFVYGLCGMDPFNAITHSMTTIATGGFSNYDQSFIALKASEQYAACFFMFAAALPLMRYVELAQGQPRSIWQDPQVRGFIVAVVIAVAVVFAGRLAYDSSSTEQAFRESLFNTISLMTGTGYGNAEYDSWGAGPLVTLFLVGLIGGCAGSTCCSIKIFRFQILGAVAYREFQQARYPNGMFALRYAGRKITTEVETSVVAFFFLFVLSLGVITLMLAFCGLDLLSAASGAMLTLANIGAGFGDIFGPNGGLAVLPDSAKWILIFSMLLGRLELLSLLVLLSPGFWRR